MANSEDVTAMLGLATDDGTLDNCVIVGENTQENSDGSTSPSMRIFTPDADRQAVIALLKRAISRLEV